MSVPLPEELDPPYDAVPVGGRFENGFLPDNGVHVWLVPVASVSPDLLLPPERERANRFHQAADADRFATARLAARRLAAAYLGIGPKEVDITGGRHEKPFIANRSVDPLHFNLSHSGQLVLIGFSRRPVGVDLEYIDPSFNPQDLLSSQFDEAEQQAIAGAADSPAAFYRLWTRKEALSKALATGLTDGLKEMPVLTDDITAWSKGAFGRLVSFRTRPGYAAALCLPAGTDMAGFFREI